MERPNIDDIWCYVTTCMFCSLHEAVFQAMAMDAADLPTPNLPLTHRHPANSPGRDLHASLMIHNITITTADNKYFHFWRGSKASRPVICVIYIHVVVLNSGTRKEMSSIHTAFLIYKEANPKGCYLVKNHFPSFFPLTLAH